MKGNTKKVDMYGFAAYWARDVQCRQKPLQLPSSRQHGGKGINAPEYKHSHRAMKRFNKTGGIPRGKVWEKMHRLGWRSECRKDLIRATQ